MELREDMCILIIPLFLFKYYYCFGISVSYCLIFLLDGLLDGCIFAIIITVVIVVFYYLLIYLFIYLFVYLIANFMLMFSNLALLSVPYFIVNSADSVSFNDVYFNFKSFLTEAAII